MSILTPAEAVRLLREQWANPTMLAEELFAILTADTPDTLDGPVTVNSPGNPNTPIFQLPDVNNGQQVFSFGPGGSLGSFVLNDGQLQPVDGSGQPVIIGGGGGGAGIKASFPCTIQSGGPDTYTVQLVSGATVSAIAWPAATDMAPAGTQAWAFLVGSQYYVQLPVWI